VSKTEGKTNLSRRLKQFDGLTCSTDPDPTYFTTDLRPLVWSLLMILIHTQLNHSRPVDSRPLHPPSRDITAKFTPQQNTVCVFHEPAIICTSSG